MLPPPYVIVCPMGTASCFYDMALALADALHVPADEIVAEKEIPTTADPQSTFFLFGLNVFDWYMRLLDTEYCYVAMQFEQYSSDWLNEVLYVLRLNRATQIWDYSPKNHAELTQRFRFENYVYKKCAVKIPPSVVTKDAARDIDVLFTGSNCIRRVCLINGIRRHRPHWKVEWVENHCWGAERNALIQRAHVVLNIHFYEFAILEAPRILAALCAGAVVVSEFSEDAEMDAEFAPYVALVDIEHLVEQCEYFIENPAAADRLRTKSKEWAMARTYSL
jgi:hypothetical protein